MQPTWKVLTLAVGAAVALSFAPIAEAECGVLSIPLVSHTGVHIQFGKAHLLRAALVAGDQEDQGDDGPTIVGFWHVKMISDGVSSGIPGGIPKGAPVDAGYSQWHSDGTEIMNSGARAPNTGNFCLGVWTKVGPRQYTLNHFAASWDPTKGPIGPAGPAGELIGPANIKENMTLSMDGKSFTGTFSIDQYDEAGNLLVHLQGSVTGTRITVDTPPSSIF
jgi:hypothetical protein